MLFNDLTNMNEPHIETHTTIRERIVQDSVEPPPSVCPVCAGELTLLGILGRLYWLVCRDCGIQVNTRIGG